MEKYQGTASKNPSRRPRAAVWWRSRWQLSLCALGFYFSSCTKECYCPRFPLVLGLLPHTRTPGDTPSAAPRAEVSEHSCYEFYLLAT